MSTRFRRAQIHPYSIKAIKKGHPWITKDQYSDRFKKDVSFIVGIDAKGNDQALLLNDPHHPQIKARLWATKLPLEDSVYNFKHELSKRIKEAIEKRALLKIAEERENYYLIFGEADFLPGLFILHIKDTLLIQTYTSFWDKYKKDIVKFLKINLQNEHIKSISFQERNFNRKSKGKNLNKEFVIQEFGVNYQINLESYDIGIYTDMSAIRKSLIPYMKKSNSMLNLFSYTGSFSLMGLKSGVNEAVSVDISNTYNNWLLKNLELNPDINASLHTILKTTSDKAINGFIESDKTFDLIICDPPSFSKADDKNNNSFKGYEYILPKLEKIINQNGHVVVFINTHKINRNKFEKKIVEILKKNNLTKKLAIIKSLRLSEDCPLSKHFPEGDYLKGFILKKS